MTSFLAMVFPLKLILTLIVVLFETFPSEGGPCTSCSFPKMCRKDNNYCCEPQRLMRRCMRGQSMEFQVVFANNNLSAYWELGTKQLKDLSPSSLGSVSLSEGQTIVSNGIQGKALRFDGDPGLKLADYSGTCLANTSQGLSVSLWLKYGNISEDSQVFFTFGKDVTTVGGDRLQIYQPNKTLEELAIVFNSERGRLSIQFPCPWNIWSHIVVSWDKRSFVIYRNGMPINKGHYDICFGCNNTHGKEAHLGDGVSQNRLNATVDELAMWCTELNAAEVKEIYEYYEGRGGYYLNMDVTFETTEKKTQFNQSVPIQIPGSTVDQQKCNGSKRCSVSIFVESDNGDLVTPFIANFGPELNAHYTTIVPIPNITFHGDSLRPGAIDVKWQVDEDRNFSIYRHYNLSLYQTSSPSDIVYNVHNERYDLQRTFENLTAYTEYNITLTQHFLGGPYKSSTITVMTIEIAPGPPQNVEAIAMNQTCIKIQWKNPNEPIGGKVRGFLIYFTSLTRPLEPLVVKNITTNQQQSYDYNVCGLSPLSEYRFNVSCYTVATGPSSKSSAAKTPGEFPAAAPGNVKSHNGTAPNDTSTCMITWTTLSAEDSKGNLTSFRLTYFKEGSNLTMYCEIGVCNTTKILKDLDFYSKYVVTVAATNLYGIGPSSKPVYCFTEEEVPTAPPVDFNAKPLTSTSLLVIWGPVPKESQNGKIIGHHITYIKEGDSTSNMKSVDVKGELSNRTMIHGLEKYTSYVIYIKAYNSKGTGNESSSANVTVRTDEDVPDGVPSNLTVLERTNVSCMIAWTGIAPGKANGVIQGYEVSGNDTNQTDTQNSGIGHLLTCDLNATLTGLLPYRIYELRVSAFNSKGSSNKSDVLECMTDEGAPLISPPNLRCTAKTSTTIEVCWNEIPMLQKQGLVRSYIVEYQLLNNSASSPPSQTSSSDFCVEINNLEKFSLYSFRVKAVTVLEGNFSATPSKCMTLEGCPSMAPANITGNNLTAYSLFVAWGNLSGPFPGILRGFIVYWRVANASEDTIQNITLPLTTRRHTIENLLRETVYCVQVAGFSVCPGVKSPCVNISTGSKMLPPPDVPPERLYQMANSTTKTCSIEWSKPNVTTLDPDGRITGYTIFYRVYGTNDTWNEVNVDGQNTQRHVLSNLEEYTKYEIRVAGFNIYGAGNKSVTVICFTKEAAPSAPPRNVEGINSSSTSISLSWKDIEKKDQNGRLISMGIDLWEDGRKNETFQTFKIKPNNAAQRRRRAISIDPDTNVITGLKKFTKYAIQVYGITIAAGPKSPVIYVTTAEDAPTASVSNLTVTNSSSTSLLFTWSRIPSQSIHGILRYFVIFYWKDDWPIKDMKNVTVAVDDVRVDPKLNRTAEFQFNMTRLEIWTNYTVQVAGFTVAAGTRTRQITVSTDEDKPCLPPDNIRYTVPKTASLRIIWDKVVRECRNGIIRGYRLIYEEHGPGSQKTIINLTSDQREYTIENMNNERNYTVSVLAYTSKGDGNASFDLARPDRMGPKNSPVNVTAENITSPTTIPVEWKPIVEPDIDEKLLGYRVMWRAISEGLNDIDEAPWQETTVRKEALSYTIKDLNNFVHYQIQVAGFTRGGYGPSGIRFADTCRCFKRIATNYRDFPPYNSVNISKNRKDVKMFGMIPLILNNLTTWCCQTCKSHGPSYVDFVNNGHNKSAYQYNELQVANLIDNTNDLSFPIYGWKWQNTYQEIYRYIPLVESPGFAFLLLEPQTESPLRSIIQSILGTWPYLLITCLMALVAGIIVWFLDTATNEEQFPHTYFTGIACGWWWAFITMTTLGYGDKVPISNRSRVFSVVWILMGLVIYGILSGSICTAFTTVIYQASTQLYGSEVAAIYNTPEYRFGVRRSAKVNTKANYTRFDDILQALLDGQVTGILMDTYEAGSKAKEFKNKGQGRIRIQKIFDYASTFGVVLAGPSARLYQCSREWMNANRAEVIEQIEKYMGVVEEEKINELVELATGLFDADSPTFKDFLKYSLIGWGSLVTLGLFWEIYYHKNKKKKNKLESTSEAIHRKESLTKELSGFTRKYLENLMDKLTELKQKHKEELKAFRENNKHLYTKKTSRGFKLLQLDIFRSDI